MPKYRNATADETVVAVSAVKNLLREVVVRQHTNDAPVLYLQLFDLAAPTLGTTKPNLVIEVPAGIAKDVAYNQVRFNGNHGGKYLTTALGIGVTTTPDGLTAPDAGDEPEVEINYEEIA